MAVLRHNPRLSALPCENMRGCTFAENFVTAATVANAYGTYGGSGTVTSRGMTTDGNGFVYFSGHPGDGATNYASFVIRFSTSTSLTSERLLMSNVGIAIKTVAADGFAIWLDADGVKANHSDGVSLPTRCAVDVDYADGEIHTATYLVDLDSGSHSLYVDALAVNTQTTTISTTFGASTLLAFSSQGGATGRFVGTTYKARIFDQLLTEAEHDLYHADTLTSFLDEPLASWRCDSIGNDTDSNTIHDRTVNHNDLYKGDRSTAAYFPTFDTDKYSFDKVDDYVSNFPTLPSAYTLSYLTSTPQLPYPVNTQETTTTTKTSLETSGDFWGYLHNVVLVNKTLTLLEQYHLEYMQQYYQWRGRAWGKYNHLITEGCCVMALFLDQDRDVYRDYSDNLANGVARLVTRNGSDGVTFATGGDIRYAHDAVQQLTEGTIVVMGDFSSGWTAETYITKNLNYKLRSTVGGNLIFGGSSSSTYMTATDWRVNEQIAVTFKSGDVPQFYFDGVYDGDGSGAAVLNNASTSDINIGNNFTLNDTMDSNLYQVAIFDKILTDREIKALYESAKYIRENPMETGNRTRVRQVFTAAAVDEDVDPGGPFQLIDISINFNTAPTTSEDISITSINGDSDAVVEHTFDPSTSSDTSHVFRFDKRFPDSTTIAIDYTNTDGRTITVNTVYQLDQSVV